MNENQILDEYNTVNLWLSNFLSNLGISDTWVSYVKCLILIAITIVVVYLLQLLVRKLLSFIFNKITQNTPLSVFKHAVSNRLPHYLALVVPYSFVRSVIPIVFIDFNSWISPCIKITDIYMVFMVIWTLMSIVRSLADVIQEKDAFKNKPFKSYLQVIQIIFYIFGVVAIFSILTGKSATAFFAAMGAASAVLMLMFKDTIMGFVSSIQLSSNDMLRLGDWITMNKYGADGTVEEINLTTVKVVNFDKTITTIPTYALISDSFQNWRGMQQSGGRRFKRSLFINQSDIYFMSDDELTDMKKVEGLHKYIEKKQQEFEKLNASIKYDLSQPLNGHRLTNGDLFVEYATWYLKTHPRINQRMTLMVRTLSPTSEGLPIELYTFTNTVLWAEYEGIIIEIINHLISSLKYFNLRIHTTTAADIYEIAIKETPVLLTKNKD